MKASLVAKRFTMDGLFMNHYWGGVQFSPLQWILISTTKIGTAYVCLSAWVNGRMLTMIFKRNPKYTMPAWSPTNGWVGRRLPVNPATFCNRTSNPREMSEADFMNDMIYLALTKDHSGVLIFVHLLDWRSVRFD